MEHNASIDAVYDAVERIELQKKRLNRNLMALSISALLGLVINTFVFELEETIYEEVLKVHPD